MKVTQRTDNQKDAHIVEEVEELDVLQERHWCEKEEDADVVEGAEHEMVRCDWLVIWGCCCVGVGGDWYVDFDGMESR